MPVEIERKYLVNQSKLPPLTNGVKIVQGYISTSDETTVRIRLKGDQCFLTLKGQTDGISRLEFEYPIPAVDAKAMLSHLCQGPKVEKIRYEIAHAGLLWELDIFEGDNQGLIVAEVELENENTQIPLPTWVTEEVSAKAQYYNSNLLAHPYKKWNE